MKNKDVAALLTNMGTLLEIQGENTFKIRAYYKAAENISQLSEDIEQVKNEKRLSEIPGVGKAIEEKITDYLETGAIPSYQKLIKTVPESLLDIVHIPSVGPKKTKLFFDELKVKNIEQLKKAAETGKLLSLPGIQEKTVEKILKGIGVVELGQERMNLGTATETARECIDYLKALPIDDISAAGSLRRGKETVRDIDILIVTKHPQKIMDAFVAMPTVQTVQAHGETKSSVLTKKNVQIDLRVVPAECFGAALLYFTGSKQFNIRIRQVAIKKGMKINEYGVFKVTGGKEQRVASRTEHECFRALGLPDIPPELREEIGEEELFTKKQVPDLISLKDIKGEFHVHSTYSDGRDSIAQMAQKAKDKGYRFLAISDHSSRLRIAGGVSPENLIKKRKEIQALNKKDPDFKIWMGTEVEIDSEGNLDYNDEILKGFDVVIAAIHSGFEQTSKQLTHRLIKAIEHPSVNMIAHPTGVHLGKREPYDIDFRAVCQAAVKHNVFLEINAFPIRLDLNSSNIHYARQQGVRFVINTDAHRTDHMDYMPYGISLARRGWLTKKDVLNACSLKEIEKQLKKHV